MSRSKWKGNFVISDEFLPKLAKKPNSVIINSRFFLISKKLVKLKVFIHNGLFFKKFVVSKNFIGQKTGNLFLTRKHFNKFKSKLKKN